ncbi:complement C1q tumor necrosis factor-related protein 7-like [Labrus mixtus]|uniref:complement C1q tumor necrosis factor-related protein 7-like n=1 Tax=Labrus mixtus TaxID=508554 RepID=UPI0029C0720F|nr:complement C1q tumor necrosis factor-related protein 7-like [Labrus mixtus]
MTIFNFLLFGLFSVVMAMPESPLQAPPTPPGPPMHGPGRMFFPEGENMTGPGDLDLEEYCQVLLQVPVPPDQLPWYCQCTQCRSQPGPKGEPGERGVPGRPGSPGRRGMTGFRGPPGFVGRAGIKGQKGEEGEKGEQGTQGFTGAKGGRGFKGDKGEPGLEGRSGVQGPKGDDGVCPESCDSSHVPPGPSGLPGPSGPRGLPGRPGLTGSEGPKGDMGEVGVPGVPGSVGGKGEPGSPGDCNCTDGGDGAPGPKGGKGDMGNQGQVGVSGPQGPQGDMGPMGMMGPPGPCMSPIQSAFSAGLETSYPPPNAPVVFSKVLYNLQGGYDPVSGLYTAPINGTYMFSFHLTVHERVLKVGLFHNFRPIVITTDPKVLGTTSHSVVLHLARGDQVWVQVKNSVTNGMYAGAESSSTFSGFLLHPESCDLASLRSPVPFGSPPEGEYSWVSMTGSMTEGGSK